jgi:hypothetical protein
MEKNPSMALEAKSQPGIFRRRAANCERIIDKKKKK